MPLRRRTTRRFRRGSGAWTRSRTSRRSTTSPPWCRKPADSACTSSPAYRTSRRPARGGGAPPPTGSFRSFRPSSSSPGSPTRGRLRTFRCCWGNTTGVSSRTPSGGPGRTSSLRRTPTARASPTTRSASGPSRRGRYTGCRPATGSSCTGRTGGSRGSRPGTAPSLGRRLGAGARRGAAFRAAITVTEQRCSRLSRQGLRSPWLVCPYRRLILSRSTLSSARLTSLGP
jgi:hypothetical protein